MRGRLVLLAALAALAPLAGSGTAGKVVADFPVELDLSSASGVDFTFTATGVTNVYRYVVHLKSGSGWYGTGFVPPEEERPCAVRVLKQRMKPESAPAGWRRISAIRITAYDGEPSLTKLSVSDVRPVFVRPDVLVVYAESVAQKGGKQRGDYLSNAGRLADTLDFAGVVPLVVADTELSEERLRGVRAVALPYNPSVLPETVRLLTAFSARGGRMLVCWSLPELIGALLGVKTDGTINPSEGDLFGFRKVGGGLPDQPAYAPQHSWKARRIVAAQGVETLAVWGRAGDTNGEPALVRTNAGAFMGHTWQGGVEGDQADLMRAIVCDLDPALREKTQAARQKERARAHALEGTVRRGDGEFRALWALTARGVGGRNWDASARFVAENGFNAIFYPLGSVGASVDRNSFAECLSACRRHGLKCHVWTICQCSNAARTPDELKKRLHDGGRYLVSATGKETRWFCPSHPENRRLVVDTLVTNAALGADGIHLDYMRYPDRGGCFCAGCHKRFEADAGTVVTNWPADVRAGGAQHIAWQAFRVKQITETVREASRRIRRECPGVTISAAVFPPRADVYESQAQDWQTWCREGLVDFVCPMDYTDSKRSFEKYLAAQGPNVCNAKVYPGIGMTIWNDDVLPALRLASFVNSVRKAGCGGFAVYGLGSRAETVLPQLVR